MYDEDDRPIEHHTRHGFHEDWTDCYRDGCNIYQPKPEYFPAIWNYVEEKGWHSKEEWEEESLNAGHDIHERDAKIASLEAQLAEAKNTLAEMANTIATQDEMLLDASPRAKDNALKGDEERGEAGGSAKTTSPSPINKAALQEKKDKEEG